jgi:hypothetical protein
MTALVTHSAEVSGGIQFRIDAPDALQRLLDRVPGGPESSQPKLLL